MPDNPDKFELCPAILQSMSHDTEHPAALLVAACNCLPTVRNLDRPLLNERTDLNLSFSLSTQRDLLAGKMLGFLGGRFVGEV